MPDQKIMSGAEFCRIRRGLDLSQNGLATMWQLGKGGGRTIRRWESEEVPISGPVAWAILSMHAGYRPKRFGGGASKVETVDNARGA